MKKSSNDKPTVDVPAITATEAVMARADQFSAVLRSTHDSIPALLSEAMRLESRLGGAAISGSDVDQLHAQLAACQERRADQVRQRHAAAEGLLALEAELNDARAGVEQERERIAGETLIEFSQRWSRACGALAALHAEAQQLTAVLHTKVNAVSPYTISVNAATGQSELRFTWPVEQSAPVTLPPELDAVVGALIRLSGAISMCAGIRSSQQMDERGFQLALRRGQPTVASGSYRVVQRFTHFDGPFEPGTVIDATCVGFGMLQRLLATGGRHLRPTSLESAVA